MEPPYRRTAPDGSQQYQLQPTACLSDTSLGSTCSDDYSDSSCSSSDCSSSSFRFDMEIIIFSGMYLFTSFFLFVLYSVLVAFQNGNLTLTVMGNCFMCNSVATCSLTWHPRRGNRQAKKQRTDRRS